MLYFQYKLKFNETGLNVLSACFAVQAEDSERREKNLEEAKKIVIEKDASLPEPDAVSLTKLIL